jgi:hypothetical protein
MQNFYCDHRNFESVNQTMEAMTSIETLAVFGQTGSILLTLKVR